MRTTPDVESYLERPAASPLNKSASPGLAPESAYCQNVSYVHPAGRVPTVVEYEAIQSGLVLANAALLPVHVVHQSVVV
jgi:hypothetical protein